MISQCQLTSKEQKKQKSKHLRNLFKNFHEILEIEVMGNDDCNHNANNTMVTSNTTSHSSSYSSITDNPSYGSVIADTLPEVTENLGPKFRILKRTDQIHELQTKLRNVETSRSEFKFVADRLIRMVIEEGLNQLRKNLVIFE